MADTTDINFDCPLCGQNLDAPDDMIGLFIECPGCEKIIKVPSPSAQQKASALPQRKQPPRPEPTPQAKATENEKSSTIPLNLPPNLGVPPTPQRKIIIKRSEH
ncbi:MAG: hypothetical protein V1929_07040 [bacterium]